MSLGWTLYIFGVSRTIFCLAQANAPVTAKQKTVRVGLLLPHEIFSAFYHFNNGELFYSLLTGPPDAAKLRFVSFPVRCKLGNGLGPQILDMLFLITCRVGLSHFPNCIKLWSGMIDSSIFV